MMTMPATTQLLRLPDQHGALLADFDLYPHLDLLYVRWHGHLTDESLVRGVQAGLCLFEGQPLPGRVLTDHSQASGEWGEALPWLHYEWLPGAAARGVRQLAHVLSPDPASRLAHTASSDEFLAAVGQALRAQAFRHLGPAWHWLTRR